MATAICKLKSISPYSQSKHIEVPKDEGENAVDFEKRTWMERMHVTTDGYVFIPPMSFTNSIAEAARHLGMQVPGKGKSTFTKHFEAGVRVVAPLITTTKKSEVLAEELFVPSDGVRGSGKRVTKFFPRIEAWEGTVTYMINDPVVTKEAFTKAIHASGTLIGIGRFRPKNLGYYGMFSVEDVRWTA